MFCQSSSKSGSAAHLAGTSTRGSAGESGQGGQAPITCPPQVVTPSCVYSGVDTISLSLHVDLEDSILVHEIGNARDIAREYEQDKVPFTFFSPQWNVHRSGRKHHRYHISNADTHVFFNQRSPRDPFPNCIIEIGSLSSHDPGPWVIFAEIEKYLKSCGVKIVSHAITRVDLSTDFVGVDINDLDLENGDKWISRARSFSVHKNNWKLSGVSIGKGNTMARIYEKRIEMNEKRATSKSDFFNRQWGLMASDKKTPVVRVEFQARSETLREFQFEDIDGINTLEDLSNCLNGIWGYFSRTWVRQAAQSVDRANKNHKQAKLSPFWILVQSVDFNQPNQNIWRKKRQKNYIDVDALIDQGVGCLISAASASLEKIEDWKEVCARVSSIAWDRMRFKECHDEQGLYEKICLKFNENQLHIAGLST